MTAPASLIQCPCYHICAKLGVETGRWCRYRTSDLPPPGLRKFDPKTTWCPPGIQAAVLMLARLTTPEGATAVSENKKKTWVKQRYAALAGAQEPCCAAQDPCCPAQDSCCASQPPCGAAPSTTPAERLGYTPEELASVPDAADLGLGCGNPLALASISPGETVLDLGSGAGLDAFLAAARVGPTGKVIGVDLTPEMIEKAKQIGVRSGFFNVDFRLGDIEAIPVDDASVDLVISNCVLCLVPDKTKAFREIARVLKPGGRAAISDIVLDGPLPDALRGDRDAYCSCISGAAPRADYLAAIRGAGLTDITITFEFDAADLLAADCCGPGLALTDLTGILTSISLTARKPAGGRS